MAGLRTAGSQRLFFGALINGRTLACGCALAVAEQEVEGRLAGGDEGNRQGHARGERTYQLFGRPGRLINE